MKKELEKILLDKYPAIFDKEEKTVFAQRGFEIGDGWFDLVDVLCHEITERAKYLQLKPICMQIKEKFGLMRFYLEGGDDYIDGMINMADSFSGKICENCGSNKYVTTQPNFGSNWIRTLCCDCRVLTKKI